MNKIQLVRNAIIGSQARKSYKEELLSLVTSGAQYIDTGFMPNQDTRVVMSVATESVSRTQFYFGARTTSSSVVYDFLNTRTGYNNNSSTQAWGMENNVPCVIDKDKRDNYINGVLKYTSPEATFQPPFNMFLFTTNTAGTPTAGFYHIGKFYSCQIYDNGVLVRDYIPVLDHNNTPCMYDKVNKTLNYNKGTVEFTYERVPYIQKLEYASFTGTQYIKTGILSSEDTEVDITYNMKNNVKIIFGSRTSSANNNIMVGVVSASSMYSGFGGPSNSNPTTGVSLINAKNRLILSRNTYTINGIDQVITRGTFTDFFEMYLGSVNTNDSVDSRYFIGDIYEWNVKKSGVLVQSLIPVIDNDDKVCFYDKITNTLIYNADSGELIAGPTI